MADYLSNIKAPDSGPTSASTIDGTTPYTRAIIDVQNNAIYWQAKTGPSRGEADWFPSAGVYMAPGSRKAPVPPNIYGFRFWAATPVAQLPVGQGQAQVTVHLV